MKHYLWFLILIQIIFTGMVIHLSGCSGNNVSSTGSDAEMSTATTITTTPLVIGGGLLNPVMPNPGAFVESGSVAGANTEAAEIKSAAQSYFVANGVYPAASGDLADQYIHLTLKADYYFDRATGEITRVDSVSGGWADIVFSLAAQKWTKGEPDNDHRDDLDVP